MILYQVYLWVLVTETMTFNVKQIASCFGPAIEKFTLPLDTTKRVQVAMVSSNEISSDDCIQLRCCPQAALLLGGLQLVANFGPNPLCQLGGNPSQDWVRSAVSVGNNDIGYDVGNDIWNDIMSLLGCNNISQQEGQI